MTEKRSDWWKAIAGLAMAALLAAGFWRLFRGQGQPPAATLPAVATATPTARSTTTPANTATPTETALPTGTPPPRHLSEAVEMAMPEGFWPMDLAGDVMAGSMVINDEYKIVTWDLTTGTVKPVSSAEGFKTRYFARISESWVVWIEGFEAGEDQPDAMKLQVYDREKQREFTLEAAAPSALDLSGDVVVWDEWREGENNWDVFAHNLRTGQRWTVAGRPNGQLYSHISGQWVIYLDYAIPFDQPGSIALWAYNLESGEDSMVGQVVFPTDASRGTHHAISDGLVVWAAPSGEFDYPHRLMGLDLNTPGAQPFLVMPGDFSSLQLFNDILVYHWQRGKVLYDLRRGERLAFINPPLGTVATAAFVSGDRVVWATTDNKLYTAGIGP